MSYHIVSDFLDVLFALHLVEEEDDARAGPPCIALSAFVGERLCRVWRRPDERNSSADDTSIVRNSDPLPLKALFEGRRSPSHHARLRRGGLTLNVICRGITGAQEPVILGSGSGCGC